MGKFGMMCTSFTNGISKVANTVGFQLKKHSPEILIGGGILAGLAATVTACIATTKASEVIGEAQTELDDIQKVLNDPEVPDDKYTEEDAKSDRKKVYVRTGLKMVKLYALPAGLTIASISGILGGSGILNKRNASLAATLASTTIGFEDYRKRLIEKFGEKGEELDKELRFGTEEVEIKEKIVDEDGKEKTIKKKVKVYNGDQKLACDYTRVFDWHNPYWKPDMNYNLMFMRGRQSWSGIRLEANGYLFFNDVLKECGFSKTKAGQTVGWVYDPENNKSGDNSIDFRITEAYSYDDHGQKLPILLLDFNCDGSILDNVEWEESKWEIM